MLDLLDLLLLRCGIPSDDWTLTFRRIDGSSRSRTVYFLPWHTPLHVAHHFGFTPLEFLACYEMPAAIVSSAPELSVQAMHCLVDDAETVLKNSGARGDEVLIVGLSIGSYPATYLANRIGARLCAVAGADRADLMLWQSRAARHVKRRCMQRGVDLARCSRAMAGLHPVQNLSGLAQDSMFIVGTRDPFIPPRRSKGLLRAVRRHAPQARVVTLHTGHVKTMVKSACYQRAMLGVEAPRAWWHVSTPAGLLLPLSLARAKDS
jgi:pimeloyl-ACP methyl ester carboxylesterase